MAMRETVRSLKAYFILSALLGAFVNLRVITAGAGGFAVAGGVIGLGFSLAFLYVGLRLRQLLLTAPNRVTTLLIVTASFFVLSFLIDLVLGFGGRWPLVLLELLITWYLFVNVRRLAAEAQPRPTSQPSSGGNVERG